MLVWSQHVAKTDQKQKQFIKIYEIFTARSFITQPKWQAAVIYSAVLAKPPQWRGGQHGENVRDLDVSHTLVLNWEWFCHPGTFGEVCTFGEVWRTFGLSQPRGWRGQRPGTLVNTVRTASRQPPPHTGSDPACPQWWGWDALLQQGGKEDFVSSSRFPRKVWRLLVLCLYFLKNQQFQSYALVEAHRAPSPVTVNPFKEGTLF